MGVEKKKLTLSVDSDIILKAKELGLNLSEITENALKITSFANNEERIVTKEKLILSYQEVFQTMSPILKKWGVEIPIGDYGDYIDKDHQQYDTFTYYLTPDEIYLWDDIIADEEPLRVWKLTGDDLPVEKFYDPERIIKVLIDKLYETAEKNRVKLQKLEVITNLLKLLDQENVK